METKEIIAGEYIFRGESSADNKSKTIKKHKSRLAGIIAIAFILVSGTVTAFALNEKKEPVNNNVSPAPTQTIADEDQNGTVVLKHPVSPLYKMLTLCDYEDLYQTLPKKTQADDIISVGEITDTNIGNQAEESIGLLSYTGDVFAENHAKDPKLPSYLSCKINKNFCISLSQDELYELMKLVEAEAPKEDIYGKILVANVVLNRLNAGWSSSVHNVIFAKNQFTPTSNPYYWNSVKITDSTREAVKRTLLGEDYSQGALYFFAWELHPNLLHGGGWRSKLELLFIHGGHAFLK